MSLFLWSHRWQPTGLRHPWDSPGKNTGVGCHFPLQFMKVKRESEVAQSYLTLSDPMDCSLPGSSIYGILQARVLEWGAIAFSVWIWSVFKYLGMSNTILWVSCRCWSKVSQTRRLEITENYSHSSGAQKSKISFSERKSGCHQPARPLEALDTPFLASFSFYFHGMAPHCLIPFCLC